MAEGAPTILAVVGSHRWPTTWHLDIVRGLVEAHIAMLEPDRVISGGAPGVDTIAMEVALDLGIPFTPFTPMHQRWKPDGFEARNLEIANRCTHLFAVRYHASLTFGSGWTALQSERMGKPTKTMKVFADGTYKDQGDGHVVDTAEDEAERRFLF